MYADVVMGIDFGAFEEILERLKSEKGYTLDTELEFDDLNAIVDEFKALYLDELQEPFPTRPTITTERCNRIGNGFLVESTCQRLIANFIIFRKIGELQ